MGVYTYFLCDGVNLKIKISHIKYIINIIEGDIKIAGKSSDTLFLKARVILLLHIVQEYKISLQYI